MIIYRKSNRGKSWDRRRCLLSFSSFDRFESSTEQFRGEERLNVGGIVSFLARLTPITSNARNCCLSRSSSSNRRRSIFWNGATRTRNKAAESSFVSLWFLCAGCVFVPLETTRKMFSTFDHWKEREERDTKRTRMRPKEIIGPGILFYFVVFSERFPSLFPSFSPSSWYITRNIPYRPRSDLLLIGYI